MAPFAQNRNSSGHPSPVKCRAGALRKA